MRGALFAVLVVVVAPVFRAPSAPAAAHVPAVPTPGIARLSNDAAPVAYDLTLNIASDRAGTPGSETIDVETRRELGGITLNAAGITVHGASIDGRSARVVYHRAIEQIVVRTGAPLRAGRHRVKLTFDSASEHVGKGIFAQGYEKGFAFQAMFEPSSARTAFPCFDEPAFRATFTVHVRSQSEWTVISNMPLRARRPGGGRHTISDFAPTPPMPVYLLTLDIGTFTHVDGAAAGVPIRIFAQPGREGDARRLLADAKKLVPFYAALFHRPFPLPKLDIVVAPGYFESALEGWGAITIYAESVAFDTRWPSARRTTLETLAHEIAHQWCGDLVTMRWWRDAFVSEGVAQFAEHEAERRVFPGRGTVEDVDRSAADLMAKGVPPRSQPVLQPIATDLDRDAGHAFDQATYDEGAAVLAGWRDVVGDAAMRRGLQRYVARHAYASATSEDFWDALGGARARAYASSWLAQRGFPIVDVRSSCEGNVTRVRVSQMPFVSDPHSGAAYRAQRWIVPIVLRTASQERRVLMADAHTTIALRGCGALAVDPDARPYYLLRYADDVYADRVRVARLSVRERARLLRDASTLHAAAHLSDRAYLALLFAARDPLPADVWAALAVEYRRINWLARESPQLGTLAAHEVAQLAPLAVHWGRLKSASGDLRPAGGRAVEALGMLGGLAPAGPFHRDYTGIIVDDSPDVPSPRGYSTAVIAGAAASAGDVARSEAMLRASPGISQAIPEQIGFLSHVGPDALASTVLSDAMTDGRLTQKDPARFLALFGERHPRLAYEYLRAHLRDVLGRTPPAEQARVTARIVADVVWPAAPPAELESFLAHSFPGDERVVRDASARIEQHWHQRRALLRALDAYASHAPR